MSIKDNILKIDPKGALLVVVTKKRSVEEMEEAINSGIKAIGESQLQEAMDKFSKLNLNNIKKHFVGHIQTNKARKIVEMFDVIESIDSLKIAKEINKYALSINKIQEVYFQINIGEEDSKYGLALGEAQDFYNKLLQFTNIKVTGVMSIAPLDDNPRPYFRKMKELFDLLPLNHLSMGMSNDYEVALEEGATEIRLGKAIFGQRK